jgi:hypothetical protein
MDREKEITELYNNYTSISLHIKRIPEQTKKEFLEFAKSEFCDDFGFALKHIWDTYKGVMNFELSETIAHLQSLEERIEALEQSKEQEKTGIRMLDGTLK